MKRFFLTLIIILTAPVCYGQNLVQNGDFEVFGSGTCGSTYRYLNTAFQYPAPGYAQSWRASHGTPEISQVFNDVTGPIYLDGDPISGQRYAIMRTYTRATPVPYQSEGLFIPLTSGFTQGRRYKVSFWSKLDFGNRGLGGGLAYPIDNETSKYYVFAANNINVYMPGCQALGMQQYPTSAFDIPSVSSKQNIFTSNEVRNIYLNGWKKEVITFSPNGNYSQLWFYPQHSSSSNYPTDVTLTLDQVEVMDITNCCPDNKTFQNTTTLPEKTSVSNFIQAGNFGSGDVNVTIANQRVVFNAGNSITFSPGTTINVAGGSNNYLHAYIEGCNTSSMSGRIVIGEYDPVAPATERLTADVSGGIGPFTYAWNNGQTGQTIVIDYNNSNIPWPPSVLVTDQCTGEQITLIRPIAIRMGVEEKIEEEEHAIKVYPSPSTGLVQLQTHTESSISAAQIVVLDGLGRVVSPNAVKALTSKLYEIDLQNQSPGLYFIKVLTEKGWEGKKIILQK